MSANHIVLSGGPLDGKHLFLDVFEQAAVEMKINGFLYTQSPLNNSVYQYKKTTMNAQQCYDAVVKARNDHDQQIRERVYADIIKAVHNNELSYTYSGKIPKGLWTELTEAGFKVSDASHQMDSYTDISWDLS